MSPAILIPLSTRSARLTLRLPRRSPAPAASSASEILLATGMQVLAQTVVVLADEVMIPMTKRCWAQRVAPAIDQGRSSFFSTRRSAVEPGDDGASWRWLSRMKRRTPTRRGARPTTTSSLCEPAERWREYAGWSRPTAVPSRQGRSRTLELDSERSLDRVGAIASDVDVHLGRSVLKDTADGGGESRFVRPTQRPRVAGCAASASVSKVESAVLDALLSQVSATTQEPWRGLRAEQRPRETSRR